MPTTLYDKVIAVIGMLRNSINQKTSKIDLAPLFNASINYPVDTLTVYNNVLYRCTTSHSGEWNLDHFRTATIQDVLALTAKKSDFASDYDSDADYTQYQLVIKDGKFMECMTAGHGDAARFHNITLADIVARLDYAIKQAASLESVYAVVKNLAPAFESGKNYAVGDLCSYKGILYSCTQATIYYDDEPDASFWSDNWKRTTVEDLLDYCIKTNSDASLKSITMTDASTSAQLGPSITIAGSDRRVVISKQGLTVTDIAGGDEYAIYFNTSKSGTISLLQDLAPNFTDLMDGGDSVSFKAGQMVVFNSNLYICNEDHTTQVWDSSKWTECTIDAVLEGLIEAISSLNNNVSALEDQVLVDRSGEAVGVSTTGILPSFTGMDYVRRIFFTPSKMWVPVLQGLSVLNGVINNENNGNYARVCFRPGIFGLKNGEKLSKITFVARDVTGQSGQTGGTVYARIWHIDGSTNTFLKASTAPGIWSGESTVTSVEYQFDDLVISDASALYYVDFSTNGLSNEDRKAVGMHVYTHGGHSNNLFVYNPASVVYHNIVPVMSVESTSSSTSSSSDYNDFWTVDKYSQNSYFIHICECAGGFSKPDVGPNVSGSVVAVLYPPELPDGGYATWPARNSPTSLHYQAPSPLTFSDPDKVYFIAFDTEVHAIGSTFEGGVWMPLGVLSNSSTNYGFYNDVDFRMSTDADLCPRISFIKHVEPYRRKMTYYRDSLDLSYGNTISLPSQSDGDVEARFIVYGNGSVSTLSLSMLSGSRYAILGDSAWNSISTNTTVMLVFKSQGTIMYPTPTTDSNYLVTTELWSVEKYSIS